MLLSATHFSSRSGSLIMSLLNKFFTLKSKRCGLLCLKFIRRCREQRFTQHRVASGFQAVEKDPDGDAAQILGVVIAASDYDVFIQMMREAAATVQGSGTV
jgi:hypothetical protein